MGELRKFFSNLKLPLSLENEDIVSFLTQYYNFFESEIDSLLRSNSNSNISTLALQNINNNRKIISKSCSDIVSCLELYLNGNISESYDLFYRLMDQVKQYLIISEMKQFNSPRLFRIRSKEVQLRKCLFHIPFEEREKVKSSRYSISGFPCLYLGGSKKSSTGLDLCWFETGMPYSFSWSEFRLANPSTSISVVDFLIDPFHSTITSRDILTSLINQTPIEETLVKVITTYPLLAACSLSIKHITNNFFPEYIISQLLMSWIQREDSIDGIAYHSSSSLSYSKFLVAFNLAIPPKRVEKEGYCKILAKTFTLTDPKFINVADIISSLQDNRKKIEAFLIEVERAFKKLPIDTLREISNLCENLITLTETMSEKNIKLVYQTIDTLCILSHGMTNNNYLGRMKTEAASCNPNNQDLCQKIHNQYVTNIHPIITSFNNLDKYFTPDNNKFHFIENSNTNY